MKVYVNLFLTKNVTESDPPPVGNWYSPKEARGNTWINKQELFSDVRKLKELNLNRDWPKKSVN